jgi:hypothetical protein
MLALALGAATGGLPATYRVRATARLAGVPLVSSLELRGDVVLRPGDGPRAVRVRLASRGHACEVAGTLTADERLSLAPGQRCPIALDDPGVRGDVVATLRSGEGRLEEGRIALSLELGLAGSVLIATGGLPGLQRETRIPVDGSASIRAEGERDNSRAADEP